MATHSLRDQVAIVAMGCTPFIEHWDKGLDDLAVDAVTECLVGTGLTTNDIDAYWLGTAQGGMSGITLARPLQLHNKPVTRVENYCATGSEALRQAVYAVAAGAYDVAMAVGVEKVKDSGYQGLNAIPPPNDGTTRTLTAAAMFSMVAPAYARRYNVDPTDMRAAMARVATKNHANGARNPRAQFRREVTAEQVCNAPVVAGDLGVYDCAGVADGAAAAIVCRAEDAHRYTDSPLYVKALSFVAGNGGGLGDPDYDYTTFPEVAATAADAYRQAGITDPAAQLAMAEVHDCFTIAELLAYEAMGLAAPGQGARAVLDGATAADGRLPVNRSGGLKAKGHPVGATGVSMHAIAAMQLMGQAGAMQLPRVDVAGVFNMGGAGVANYVSILEPLR